MHTSPIVCTSNPATNVSRRRFVASAAMLAGAAAVFCAAPMSASAATAEDPQMQADVVPGTYTAQAHGHNGAFDVTVEVGDGGTIEDIQIGANDETYFVGTWSMDQVAATMVEQDTPDVDTVAGATFSTLGLINGVKDALDQAGADAASYAHYAPEPPAFEDCSAQVVVVGTGSAGLAAALQANELGLDVIVVEQLGIIGGSSGRAGYYVGGGTSFGKAAGDDYSMEDFRDMLLESNPDQPELATLFGERAGECIDWFFSYGLTDVYYDAEGAYGKGTHWGDFGHIGGFMTYAMQGALEENAIDVRMNTKVKNLVVEDGRVCGVDVESTDGQAYRISADAVVLASGGYARNKDMVAQYTPELTGYGADASMGSDGSGMLMAAEAGAVLENMSDVFYYYGENVMFNGVPRNMTYPFLMNGMIVVNEAGERFIDELSYYALATVEAFNAQPGKHGFLIMTQAMADAVIRPALDYSAYLPQMYTACADLDAVAQELGIDAAALKATVERYNGFVDAGADEDFGKLAYGLTEEFVEGPFYVAEVQPCVHMTYGGIKNDLEMRALDEAGEPILGLWCAGECTHVMLNGIGTNTIALVEGRVAAEQIAAAL